MAWRRSGDKPLSEPMMVSYRRIYASLGLNELTTAYNKALKWKDTFVIFFRRYSLIPQTILNWVVKSECLVIIRMLWIINALNDPGFNR